jgi:hypothetical protein
MKRRALVPAAAFLFFAAATVLMTWPLASRPGRLVSDPGDPYLTAWILHWDWKQFFRDPAHLFDGNIFYPARLTLAFSENLFGAAIFGFPLYFAGVAPIAVHNFLFLLGIALSGFGAWALARELTGSGRAALIAGIAYAFAPFHFDQLPHIPIQWAGWIPLAILFLWRYLESSRRSDLFWFTLFFVANAWTCVYYAIFGAIGVAVTLAVKRPAGRSRRALVRPLGFAFAAALVAVAPIYAPYVEAAKLYHFRRSIGEMKTYSATLKSFLSAGARSKVYGTITSRFAKPESQLFPGLLVLLLAGGTWAAARKRPRPEDARDRRTPPRALDAAIVLLLGLRLAVALTRGFRIGPLSIREPYRLSLLIFLLAVVRLSLAFPRFSRFRNLSDFFRRNRGTDVERWAAAMVLTGVVVALGARMFLFRELAEILPFVFGAIRCPTRGIVLAHLGLGVLAAIFAARRGVMGTTALAALMLVELRAAPLSLYDGDPSPPPSVTWIDGRGLPGGVLELPMKYEDNFLYVLWAASHDYPILNGYSGFFPKSFEALEAAFTAPSIGNEARALLARNQCSVVLFHRGRAAIAEQGALSAFLSSAADDGVLRPVRVMGSGSGDTVILASPEAERLLPASQAERADARQALSHPMAAPVPPRGWYFEPQNGAVFHGSTVRGSGWAAADDGMARIEVLLDGRNVGSATYGIRRPEVPMVLPRVPCGERCGYSYRIDHVAPGRHDLATRYVGSHGGTAMPPAVEIWVR